MLWLQEGVVLIPLVLAEGRFFITCFVLNQLLSRFCLRLCTCEHVALGFLSEMLRLS